MDDRYWVRVASRDASERLSRAYAVAEVVGSCLLLDGADPDALDSYPGIVEYWQDEGEKSRPEIPAKTEDLIIALLRATGATYRQIADFAGRPMPGFALVELAESRLGLRPGDLEDPTLRRRVRDALDQIAPQIAPKT